VSKEQGGKKQSHDQAARRLVRAGKWGRGEQKNKDCRQPACCPTAAGTAGTAAEELGWLRFRLSNQMEAPDVKN